MRCVLVRYSITFLHIIQGQHFDAAAGQLKKALRAHGCRLSSCCDSDDGSSPSSRSDWRISRRRHPYMWRCMNHFLVAAGAFLDSQLLDQVSLTDLRDWVAKVSLPLKHSDHDHDHEIDSTGEDLEWVVSNEDILAEFPAIEQHIAAVTYPETAAEPVSLLLHFASTQSNPSASPSCTPTHRPQNASPTPIAVPTQAAPSEPSSPSPEVDRRFSVEFLGNRSLKVVVEPALSASSLTSCQVLVRTHCCLVSTGTEMKVFRGDLDSSDEDSDQPLDLTIKGMSGGGGSKLQYPVRYGYSLVGTVVAEGK